MRPLQFTRTLVGSLRRRKALGDLEFEIIRNRLLFSLLMFVHLSLTGTTQIWQVRWGLTAYIVVAIAIWLHSVARPRPSPARRLFGVVVDLGALSYVIHLGGETTSIFYPLYLWIILGNGFRFGNRYLFAAMGIGLAGFAAVIASTPFWQRNTALGSGLLIGLLVLPVYTSTLIRKLSQAKHEAEEANQAKSMLLAGVSHELRTPLNAIIGMGHLLGESRLDSEQAQMTRTISAAGKALLSLIDALLDLSRIEAGRVSVQVSDFDLVTLLSEIRGIVAAQARARRLRVCLHVTTRTPSLLRGDRRHLHAILLNLAGNAVKFTERGTVVFGVDAAEQTGSRVRLRFEVSDTGIGIAPEAIRRIFDNFTQADDTIGERYGGTGLGLSICKRLVELMGGQIGVQSEPGSGSTFWFTIDLERQADAGRPRQLGPQHRFLALSSDPARAADLAAKLAGWGCDATVVSSQAELFQALQSRTGRSVEAAAPVGSTFSAAGLSSSRDLPILLDCRARSDATEAEFAALLDADSVDLPPMILVGSEPATGLPSAHRQRQYVTVLSSRFDRTELEAALAIAAAGHTIEMEPAVAPRPRRSLRVLIADDNRINQQVVAKILEKSGHRTETVANGEQALDALESSAFDLVLMDVNMPVLNGIEATKLYRFAALGQRRVPILALTADATAATAKRCTEAGMDACVTKPVEPARLLALIDRLVATADPEPGSSLTLPGRVEDIASHPRFRAVSLPVLDDRALVDLEALGGREFVVGLIDDFLADADDLAEGLVHAARDADEQSFQSLLHALRSAAANVGAKSLFELCLNTRSARTRDLDRETEGLVDRITTELTRLRRALLDYRSGARQADNRS